MKKSLNSIKKFIAAHPVLITTCITTTVFLVLAKHRANQLDNFMAEHGLTEEYHNWLSAVDE